MKNHQKFTIVAFGDSITEAGHQALHDRWPALLNRLLRDRFANLDIEVINAGVGGNTSREGLRRIDTDVLQHRPDFGVRGWRQGMGVPASVGRGREWEWRGRG